MAYDDIKEQLRGYILCPHQTVLLKCASDETVEIYHADYGRRHGFICGRGRNNNCSTKKSTTARMKRMCKGKSVCPINALAKNYEDACPGVNKYLHVVYRCEKRKEDVSEVFHAPTPEVTPQCGVKKSTRVRARVVEGRRTVPGTWPWQVLLLKGYRRKRFTCGGTLIHPRWVLTAAHCIKSKKKHYYTVRLGEYDRWVNEAKEQDIPVKRAIRHPLYFMPYPLNNDIALLELERPASFTDRVGTACLPNLNYEVADNDPETRCYITGWGKTKHRGYMSQMLRQVEVPPVSRAKCAVRLAKSPGGNNRKITSHMICGGDDNTGVSACQGDSGGPYVCRNKEGYWEVQGVISWGSPICSLKQRFTVFAQVSKFRKWIDKYINHS